VGLAVSDELEIAASPLVVLDYRALPDLLAQLEVVVKRKAVKTIILGLPVNMDGSKGEKAREAENFAEQLRQSLAIPVILWDERLTTAQAQKALLAGEVSRTQRKRLADKIAAALLLQAYLDSQTRKASDPE
jgi:putative holliday junction resolvase